MSLLYEANVESLARRGKSARKTSMALCVTVFRFLIVLMYNILMVTTKETIFGAKGVWSNGKQNACVPCLLLSFDSDVWSNFERSTCH